METLIQTGLVMNTRYKCPKCKHLIPLRNADFIKGIAMVSCMDCGRGGFAIEETQL